MHGGKIVQNSWMETNSLPDIKIGCLHWLLKTVWKVEKRRMLVLNYSKTLFADDQKVDTLSKSDAPKPKKGVSRSLCLVLH